LQNLGLTISTDANLIQQWVAAKRDIAAIEEELQQKGLDADTVAAYTKEYKWQRNAKRQFAGFVHVAIGAVLGFISCTLTVTNIFPGMFDAILYGLTTVAILFICRGLYFVFE
jgi:hypothetical protein